MLFSLKDRPITANLISSVIFAALIFGGGVLLAYLQAVYHQWYTSVLASLTGSALIAVIVAAFLIWRRLPKPVPQLTPENVEVNIRAWLDAFSVGVKKADVPDTFFGLIATFDNGMSVNIHRLTKFGRYVHLRSAFTISPEHKAVIDALPKEEKEIFSARLAVELAKTEVGGLLMDLEKNIVVLERRLPITPALTEGVFMDAIDQLMNAHFRSIQTFVLMIMDEQTKHKDPPPKRKPR